VAVTGLAQPWVASGEHEPGAGGETLDHAAAGHGI